MSLHSNQLYVNKNIRMQLILKKIQTCYNRNVLAFRIDKYNERTSTDVSSERIQTDSISGKIR